MSSTVSNEVRSESLSNNLSTEEIGRRSSTEITAPNSRPSASSSNVLDVNRIYEAFVTALQEPNNPKSPIGTQGYIDGYRELMKFFDPLGKVFKFVTDDVLDKLRILQSFVDKDKKGTPHFDTIQKAIDYETEHNLIKTNPENFARTLLRLHRALQFIVRFLEGLNQRPPSESSTTIATNSYDATLAHHHGFFARQTVKLALRILPSRKQLEDIIFHGNKAELLDQYETFIIVVNKIYNVVEGYYAEKKYLQLP